MNRGIGSLSLIVLLAAAPGALAAEIPYNAKPSIKVGQTIVLKGVRSDCGAAARSFKQIAGYLPSSKLGTFSDGGVGTVQSRSCGGPTPARAVRFTATAKGRESFTIAGDDFTITVK